MKAPVQPQNKNVTKSILMKNLKEENQMAVKLGADDRVRAWVFGNFGNLEKFQEKILKDFPDPSIWTSKKFFEIGGDDYVIVRADVVEPFNIGTNECNIIIPVDAKNDLTLDTAKTFIENDLGIVTFAVVKVESYNPWPPHRSHGYITETEFDFLPDDNIGRQSHKSPGSNKWG